MWGGYYGESYYSSDDDRVECETCSRQFRTQAACNQHMNAIQHWAPRYECESCTKEFRSQRAASQHMDAVGHWAPKHSCESCSAMFHSEEDADRHMRAQSHYRNYCKPCDRRFVSENNLRMHLNSKIHRGSDIVCPFCKARYTTASGVAHHLERGSCPNVPSMNRDKLYKLIRERDPSGAITQKLIGWSEEANSHYSATDRAYNGRSWECYICHRGFVSKTALNQHLNSSVHMQKVYHCPNAKARCGKEFVTLAALFNHLESEGCAFMRFERVQAHVGDLLQGRGLIAF